MTVQFLYMFQEQIGPSGPANGRQSLVCTYDTEFCIKMLPLSFVTVWTFGVRSYSCDISGKCTFGSGLEGSFCVSG